VFVPVVGLTVPIADGNPDGFQAVFGQTTGPLMLVHVAPKDRFCPTLRFAVGGFTLSVLLLIGGTTVRLEEHESVELIAAVSVPFVPTEDIGNTDAPVPLVPKTKPSIPLSAHVGIPQDVGAPAISVHARAKLKIW
jgi:hypothetical protein